MKKKKKPIVATKLPKLWGKKFNSNLGNNLGNEIAKNEGEKKDDLGRKLMGKKNCGNGIAKMRGGKNSSN